MRKKNFVLGYLFAVLLLVSAGCENGIKGNHDVTKETRQMVSFESVINEGSFNVYVSNSQDYEVVVEAESNLIPYIRTVVKGNSLVIDSKKSIDANYTITIYVKSPLVKSVTLDGSGVIMFDSLKCNSFNADINGSGEIRGKLIADTVFASIDGSGSISFETDCNEMTTDISGSGNINLNVIDKLDVNISGSGSVYYIGSPQMNVKISGSGSVIKL